MRLYSLCTLATCDIHIMKGPIPKTRINASIEDIDHIYSVEFLSKEILRIDTHNDHIQVWLKEE